MRCTRPLIEYHPFCVFFLNSQQIYLSSSVCVRVCFDTGRTSTTERRHFAHSGTRIERDQASRVRHPKRIPRNVGAHRYLCDRRLEDVDQKIKKRVTHSPAPPAKKRSINILKKRERHTIFIYIYIYIIHSERERE